MKFSSKQFSTVSAVILMGISSLISHADQVAAGSTVVLSVSADGTSPFTYQWIKDGGNLSGATGPTLTIANIQSTNAGSYSVLVANAAGSTTSNVSTLSIVTPPAITTQPASQSVVTGSNVTFTVVATGSPAPSYQWAKNGASISGATSSSYTISGATAGNAGTYTVVVSNSVSSVTSHGAVLTVSAAAVAPVITTQPVSKNVSVGASVTFTVAATGTPNPTFQWKKNGTSISGATSSSYTIASVTSGSAANYTVVASNSAGSVTSSTAVLTVGATATVPTITTQPASQSVPYGTGVTFAVTAIGNPTPTYQWKFNGANISSATSNSYNIPTTNVGNAGVYTVVVTNSAGSVTSKNATLTVTDGGQINLFWQNKATGQRSVWYVKGTVLNGGADLWNVDPSWDIAAVVDLNNDGKADLLWQNKVTGQRSVWYMDGTTVLDGADLWKVDPAWDIAGVADLNGDGKKDILWQNKTTGQRSVWYMDGVTCLGGADLWNVDTSWDIAAVVDLNGDGKVDILWQNKTTGQRSVWYLDGTTVWGGDDLWVVDPLWDIAATIDLNGDGKVDLLWQNRATGQCSAWYLNGGRSLLTSADLWTVDTNWQIVR